jgi:hypothetical protein
MAGEDAARSTSAVERALAAGGALVALAATVIDWRAVGAQQVISPLTVLYFVEAPGLAWAGAWGVFRSRAPLPWAMAGALFGFCVIGGFSIGPSYLPADALLGLAVLWRDRHAWRRWPGRAALALLAVVIQAVMMLTLIRIAH